MKLQWSGTAARPVAALRRSRRAAARCAAALLALTALPGTLTAAAGAIDGKRLFWGDTHLHSNYSFDAFLNNNLSADPDTAYRFAKGAPVLHPYTRGRVQLETPLDFLVVSDHAEYLGVMRSIYENGIPAADAGFFDRLRYWYLEGVIRDAVDAGEGPPLFASLLPEPDDPVAAASAWTGDVTGQLPPLPQVERDAWASITRAADAHNDPGRFTALIGWEWSSTPGGGNLHRIVVSDIDGERARSFAPFGSDHSPYPEDLWDWLDRTAAATGANFIAIPHNSNISKGQMFSRSTLRGAPVDAGYAATRARLEPVVEVTQIKGDSETHPALSPEDRYADYEPYPYYIQRSDTGYEPRPGDYVRSALGLGLELEGEIGVNPFRFGLIGSTDAHTGLASAEEPNFWGKMATDSIPANKAAKALAQGPSGWDMSAAGLAAVWAEDNTREAIVAALKRREVYASTGPRIRLRVAADWVIDGATEINWSDPVTSPTRVAMGGVLRNPSAGARPQFFVRALKDPRGAGLARLQMVKLWVDVGGESQEQIYDLAVADGGDADRVDRSTGRVPADAGAVSLDVSWMDPDFDPRQRALYYVRVLQIPTARHSLLDALALGIAPPEGLPEVIQERAYSSPVWVIPD